MPYREPTMSLTKKILLLLVTVAAIGSLWLYLSDGKGGSGTPLSLANSGKVVNGDVDSSILLDGWSWATLNDSSPVWYGANAGPSTSQSLNATPITASEVEWLAKNAPSSLAAVAGRMLSTASNITCSTAGCTTSSGAIPLSWFSDLGSVPGYGTMYAAWGIKAAIYVENLQIPQSQTSLTISAKNWTPQALSLSNGAGVSGAVTSADAADAWGRNLYLESAALGQFFIPTPAWSQAEPQIWYSPTVAANTALLTSNPAPATALYSDGLAAPTSAAALLTTSELTYLSSPTTGCGFALCVPSTLHATVQGYTTSTHLVCQTNDAAAKATLVTASSTWGIDFPDATHQEVLANGGSNDKSGVPTFVSGQQKLRITTYALYTGEALTNGASPGQLSPIEVAGSIYDGNHSTKAQLQAKPSLATIYPTWKLC
jgi:hypothetical protein